VTRNTPNGAEGPSALSKPTRLSAEQRRKGAARMALHRARKRRGLTCITIEVRDTEIASLIRSGYLPRERWRERAAVVRAIHDFLDQNLR
jgi:hypothetical protein